jgi:predicted SAM-dependent methyltransferase
MRTVLHVGCGRQRLDDFLEGYSEVRLDIDPAVEPDIVASLTDLGDIGQFDAVYGSHVLEHLTPGDVQKAVAEFYRVLKPGGLAIMLVPNLENIKPTKEVVYQSPAGPITGLDMFYGMEKLVNENPYMSHKTGFVTETMTEALKIFDRVEVRALTHYNLLGVGVKL